MNVYNLLGVCAILYSKTEGACDTLYADFGTHNKVLVFSYSSSGLWKLITCSKDQIKIGECVRISSSHCAVEQALYGVYNMSSNADLTSLYLTVLYFNETTSGKYSCSNSGNTDTKTICLEKTAETATHTLRNAGDTKSPNQSKTTAIVTGTLCSVVVLFIIFLMLMWWQHKRWLPTVKNYCSKNRVKNKNDNQSRTHEIHVTNSHRSKTKVEPLSAGLVEQQRLAFELKEKDKRLSGLDIKAVKKEQKRIQDAVSLARTRQGKKEEQQ